MIFRIRARAFGRGLGAGDQLGRRRRFCHTVGIAPGNIFRIASRQTLVLLFAAIIAFGGCLWGSFHFDDYSLFSADLWRPFDIRPLTYLTFWVNDDWAAAIRSDITRSICCCTYRGGAAVDVLAAAGASEGGLDRGGDLRGSSVSSRAGELHLRAKHVAGDVAVPGVAGELDARQALVGGGVVWRGAARQGRVRRISVFLLLLEVAGPREGCPTSAKGAARAAKPDRLCREERYLAPIARCSRFRWRLESEYSSRRQRARVGRRRAGGHFLAVVQSGAGPGDSALLAYVSVSLGFQRGSGDHGSPCLGRRPALGSR